MLLPDTERPGINMQEIEMTRGMMIKTLSEMVEDNGDQWRLMLVGLSKKLEQQARDMRKRAQRLYSDVGNELRSKDVVRRDTGDT